MGITVLILWRDEVVVNVVSAHENWIHAVCSLPNGASFTLIGVCGPPKVQNRWVLWDFIGQLQVDDTP